MLSQSAFRILSSVALAARSASLPLLCPAASRLTDQLLTLGPLAPAQPAPPYASSSTWRTLTPCLIKSYSLQQPGPGHGPATTAAPESSQPSPSEPPSTPTSALTSTPSASDASEISPSPDVAAAAAAPVGPASRRDKGASSKTIYPSSKDDNMGVQRNWFNALFSQLNVVHRTGMVPHLKGRQQEVFTAVEREFEALWERHIKDKGLTGAAHRGMLLCCLAIATHKVLQYESGDDELVREVVRTNLGGLAVSIMMRLHKARLWLLLRLLAEDPYKEAVRLLPSLQGDLGSLLDSEVAVGESEATWTIRSCTFHSVLQAEDVIELLPEFCCQYSMQWLEGFSEYGVRVGLEQGLAFGDECCQVRISNRLPPQSQTGGPAQPAGAPLSGQPDTLQPPPPSQSQS